MNLAKQWVKDLKDLLALRPLSSSFVQHALLELLGQPRAFQPLASVSSWDVASTAGLRESTCTTLGPSLGPAHRNWAAIGPVSPEAGSQLCPGCVEASGS